MSERALTVDRIEGDQAVLIADDVEWPLPLVWLPTGTTEGSVLRINFERDKEAEKRVKQDVEAALQRLGKADDLSENSEIDL